MLTANALRELADFQKLAYDFTYYHVHFPMDVAVLCLSSSRSILGISTAIPLRPDQTHLSAPPPVSEWVEAARVYLGLAARRQHHLAMANEITQSLQVICTPSLLHPSLLPMDVCSPTWSTASRASSLMPSSGGLRVSS